MHWNNVRLRVHVYNRTRLFWCVNWMRLHTAYQSNSIVVVINRGDVWFIFVRKMHVRYLLYANAIWYIFALVIGLDCCIWNSQKRVNFLASAKMRATVFRIMAQIPQKKTATLLFMQRRCAVSEPWEIAITTPATPKRTQQDKNKQTKMLKPTKTNELPYVCVIDMCSFIQWNYIFRIANVRRHAHLRPNETR